MNPLFVFTLSVSLLLQLPVSSIRLQNFSAAADACNALLKWAATDEAGDSYAIESSSNGIDFTTAQTVAADGLQTVNIYAVTLVQTDAAKWYRLKMTGKDGSILYSRLAAVNIRCNKQALLSIFPNPAMDKLTINYEAGAANRGSIWVNDATGKTVIKKEVNMQKGANSWLIDVQTLPPGLYYVQLRNENGIEASQKVMKK